MKELLKSDSICESYAEMKRFQFFMTHSVDFPYQTLWQYSDRDFLTGMSNAGRVGKNHNSRQISGYRIDHWWGATDCQASVNLVYHSKRGEYNCMQR